MLDVSHMRKPKKTRKMIKRLIADGEARVRKDYPRLDSISKVSLLDRAVTMPTEELAFSKNDLDIPPGRSLLRVYLPVTGRQNFNLRIDGIHRAVLKPRTFFQATLIPGNHQLSAKVKFKMFATGFLDKAFAGKGMLAIDMKPGFAYYVRAQPDWEGRQLNFTEIAIDFGAEESAGLGPAKEVPTAED